jgi:hypothetical protein
MKSKYCWYYLLVPSTNKLITAAKFNIKHYKESSLSLYGVQHSVLVIAPVKLQILLFTPIESCPHFAYLLGFKWGLSPLIRTVNCIAVMVTPIWLTHYLTFFIQSLVWQNWRVFFHVTFLFDCFNRVFFSSLWFAFKYSISYLSEHCLLKCMMLCPYGGREETRNSKCTLTRLK